MSEKEEEFHTSERNLFQILTEHRIFHHRLAVESWRGIKAYIDQLKAKVIEEHERGKEVWKECERLRETYAHPAADAFRDFKKNPRG